MTIADVVKILDGKLMAGDGTSPRAVGAVVANDLMSDVLAFAKHQCVLLTGLCNPQVIRTAEMMDIVAIIFVRGKTPDETMIQMADEMGLPIITTGHRMFSSCGLLYEHGLTGGIIDG